MPCRAESTTFNRRRGDHRSRANDQAPSNPLERRHRMTHPSKHRHKELFVHRNQTHDRQGVHHRQGCRGNHERPDLAIHHRSLDHKERLHLRVHRPEQYGSEEHRKKGVEELDLVDLLGRVLANRSVQPVGPPPRVLRTRHERLGFGFYIVARVVTSPRARPGVRPSAPIAMLPTAVASSHLTHSPPFLPRRLRHARDSLERTIARLDVLVSRLSRHQHDDGAQHGRSWQRKADRPANVLLHVHDRRRGNQATDIDTKIKPVEKALFFLLVSRVLVVELVCSEGRVVRLDAAGAQGYGEQGHVQRCHRLGGRDR
mmetsp:Transcript_1216/g.3941  ORF Transcript_1216/g.3941 Transcript_1216/m.3941 type:complete len:314 (+) Transcript_1216:1087-2028(+)